MNIKLLKNLNFAEKINAIEPVTEAGKDMLKNYKAYCYSNPVSCGVVNSFINEAQNFSFDTGMISILESVLSYIKENNISWKLASACESIVANPSSYNYIAKVGVGQVEKLLEMNEADVVSYIKAGCLKNVQYIPEFRNICKEVYKTTVNETNGSTYTVTHPVSYCEIKEGVQYFKVLGRTYKINEGKVEEAQYDDAKFNRINALLESFTRDAENNLNYGYKYNNTEDIHYTLDESKIDFTKGNNIHETFGTSAAFLEYCDTLSRTMRINEKMNFLNISTAIAEVFESMSNVCVLDCVNVLSSANGTICAITEAENNVNLTVFRSVNEGTSCNNYDFISEALKNVTRMTGVNLSFLYEARIDNDCKKQNPDEYKEIKEQLEQSQAEAMELRKKKIAMLAEKYKNDPSRIALLNKTARDLAMLEK